MELKLKILHRDRQCLYCRKPLCKKTIKLNEYIPGDNSEHNLVASCHDCFHKKGNSMPLNFIQEIIKGKK